MTAFDPRGAAALGLAASLMIGLGGCTAEPRYPLDSAEAPGGGFEPLQPRYPVRLAEAAAPAEPLAASLPAPSEDDPPPRAAPSAEVSAVGLPPAAASSGPPPSAPGPTTASVSHPPPETLQAQTAAPAGSRAPAGVAPARPAASVRSPAPVSAAPVDPPRASARSTQNAATAQPTTSAPGPFLQAGVGAGPPRFTIGAPVPPSATPPTQAPTFAPAPPVYARPTYPRSAPPAPVYARPSAPPAYARQPAPAPTYPQPAAPYRQPGAPPASSYSSNGPRPYTSVFPQGPRRGVRSAGIASTPRDPGIAPQAATLPPVVDAPPLTAAQVAALGRGRFVWPVRGALISGYGEKGGGQRNDGVDISANLGDPVHASAAGEVVYAGDQIPGQGKLVLVKHPGGWVTAYAHLSRIEVKMRDLITQGQELGQAGQTGGVDRPQLHFEIRYAPNVQVKATPVDPATLLPAG